MLISKKKAKMRDCKSLSGSSQLGKGKQNIWPEAGVLVSDVLIWFVRCSCNSQPPVFSTNCHAGEKKQMFPFVF